MLRPFPRIGCPLFSIGASCIHPPSWSPHPPVSLPSLRSNVHIRQDSVDLWECVWACVSMCVMSFLPIEEQTCRKVKTWRRWWGWWWASISGLRSVHHLTVTPLHVCMCVCVHTWDSILRELTIWNHWLNLRKVSQSRQTENFLVIFNLESVYSEKHR